MILLPPINGRRRSSGRRRRLVGRAALSGAPRGARWVVGQRGRRAPRRVPTGGLWLTGPVRRGRGHRPCRAVSASALQPDSDQRRGRGRGLRAASTPPALGRATARLQARPCARQRRGAVTCAPNSSTSLPTSSEAAVRDDRRVAGPGAVVEAPAASTAPLAPKGRRRLTLIGQGEARSHSDASAPLTGRNDPTPSPGPPGSWRRSRCHRNPRPAPALRARLAAKAPRAQASGLASRARDHLRLIEDTHPAGSMCSG